MDFLEASDQNYVIIESVVDKEITVFSACFWAKFLRKDCSIFAYSSPLHDTEIGVYLYPDLFLGLIIRERWTNKGLVCNVEPIWLTFITQR